MTSNESTIIPNSFTIYARPSRTGFFGLSELEAFTHNNIDSYLSAKKRPVLIMDFSAVEVWDIAALLWLIVALHHYKRNEGVMFLLRLPESIAGMEEKYRDIFDKSADYLRRWRFDRGLINIDTDVRNLLVPEQRDFFSPPEPRRFYLARKEQTESGILQSLISRRLAEIRELSDPMFTGSTPISPDRISKCIREFQAERIGDILNVQCGIDKRKADLFSDHLLTEALLNVQEHPNATVGLVAISLMGKMDEPHELILSVVDNGDSIPQTIFPRYLRDKSVTALANNIKIDEKYDRDRLSIEQRAEITHHATKPYVTRKLGREAEKAGMGLTYIKEDSLETFNGKLTIISDYLKLTYRYNPEKPYKIQEWHHCWHGNLLRIAIPAKEKIDKRDIRRKGSAN